MDSDGEYNDHGGSNAGGEDFRPVHYIGNKSRYLHAIGQTVDRIARPGSAACDLFAGTSVVTRRLAHRREVVSADIQAYSQVLARALTQPYRVSSNDVATLLGVAEDWLRTVRPQTMSLVAYELDAQTNTQSDLESFAALVEHGSFAVDDIGPRQLVEAKRRARGILTPDSATLTCITEVSIFPTCRHLRWTRFDMRSAW